VAGLGLQSIVVRDIVRNPACKEETLGTAAVLQFVGGLLAYLLVLCTIFWLRPDDSLAKLLVAILGSTMLFKVSDIAIYWFESQVMSKYMVWAQNGCFLIFAAIKVGLILSNATLLAFVWTTAAEALLVAVVILIMLGLRGPKLQQLSFSFQRAKKLLVDSWPLLLSGIAIMVYMRIDQIMLGQMLGAEAVGIYSAAVRISEVWYFVPVILALSLFPNILNTKNICQDLYNKKIKQLFSIMIYSAVGLALPVAFMSESIILNIYGVHYKEAGLVLLIHIWGGVFVALGVVNGMWFLAENLQKIAMLNTLIGAFMNVLLNYFFIPIYGVAGVAIATLVSYGVAAYLALFLYKKTRGQFYVITAALLSPSWRKIREST